MQDRLEELLFLFWNRADVELIAQVGTEIIRVHAEDKDPQPYNSEVYYYAQSRLVSINRTSGLISLRENLHPRDRTLTVSLLAFDGGSPRRSARSKLTINVKIISGKPTISSLKVCGKSCLGSQIDDTSKTTHNLEMLVNQEWYNGS